MEPAEGWGVENLMGMMDAAEAPNMVLGASCKGLNTLVYGQGSLELKLISAKLAAREGANAALFNPDARIAKQWSKLMYGRKSEANAPGCARVMESVEELGACLNEVQSIVLVCDTAPMEDKYLDTILKNAGDDLRRVVLISKMGVTRAKPAGPFGIGGGDAALAAGEASLRKATTARGVEMSIIRGGTLKGGGPGLFPSNSSSVDIRTGTNELGLSKMFYDGIVDVGLFMCTQSYDQYTNGAKVQKGDPCDLANPLLRAGRGQDFTPYDDEVSRTVVASAAVHALSHPSAVELTVSAAKGKVPPTQTEWAELFDNA
jgi:hypothetical protein